MMNLKRDLIRAFVKFREEVITRRTDRTSWQGAGAGAYLGWFDGRGREYRRGDRHHLRKPRRSRRGDARRPDGDRSHWPAKDVAPMIALIDDPEYAIDAKGDYQMSDIQARAILDLRLHRLTALERDKIGDELKEEVTATRSPSISRSSASREKLLAAAARRAGRDQGAIRHAAPHRPHLLTSNLRPTSRI